MQSIAKLYYSMKNNNDNLHDDSHSNKENIIQNFGYGYLAGMAGIVASHPFDTVKTNIQKNKLSTTTYEIYIKALQLRSSE